MVKTRKGKTISRLQRAITVLTSDRKTTQTKVAFISNLALASLSTAGVGVMTGLIVKDNSNTLSEIAALSLFTILAYGQYSEINFKTGKNYYWLYDPGSPADLRKRGVSS